MPTRRGLTVIELLVALAILALIIGVSVTFLRQAARGSVASTAARALATDLRYGSELTVSTQINHAVRFNTEQSSYTVVALRTPEQLVKTVTLDPSLRITSVTLPSLTAEFNTLGAATSSGSITLSHQSGAVSVVEVRPSGYVRVQ